MNENRYAPGDAVWHPAHGKGVVRELDGQNPVVDFGGGSLTTILATSTKLQRAQAVDQGEQDRAACLTRLREWRRQRAFVDRRQAYHIATDKVLVAIADARPRTIDDLVKVPGVGPGRVARYGTEILSCVGQTGKPASDGAR